MVDVHLLDHQILVVLLLPHQVGLPERALAQQPLSDVYFVLGFNHSHLHSLYIFGIAYKWVRLNR